MLNWTVSARLGSRFFIACQKLISHSQAHGIRAEGGVRAKEATALKFLETLHRESGVKLEKLPIKKNEHLRNSERYSSLTPMTFNIEK